MSRACWPDGTASAPRLPFYRRYAGSTHTERIRGLSPSQLPELLRQVVGSGVPLVGHPLPLRSARQGVDSGPKVKVLEAVVTVIHFC